MSDQAVAEIASGVIQDCGTVAPNECSDVIDRNKIRRERKKCRSKLCYSRMCQYDYECCCLGIYFDGRKDRRLTENCIVELIHSFISEIYIAPLQDASSDSQPSHG